RTTPRWTRGIRKAKGYADREVKQVRHLEVLPGPRVHDPAPEVPVAERDRRLEGGHSASAIGRWLSLQLQLPAPLYFLDNFRQRQPGVDIGRAFADPVLDVGHVPLRIEVGRQSRIALLIEARGDAGPLVGALVEVVREVGLQRPPLRAVLLEAGVVD